MKQFYSRFRVMLLTFAFGLAVVLISNVLYEKWSEIPVDLPEVESEIPIVVIIPTKRNPMPFGGGSHCCDKSEFKVYGLEGKKTEDIPTKTCCFGIL